MREIGSLIAFLLIGMMVFPAYADVTSVSLEKDVYSKDENISFVGSEEEGQKSVFVVIRGPTGEFIGMVADPSSDLDGTFSTIPRPVSGFFQAKGLYNATAFTDEQKEEDGVLITLNYDGDKVTVVPTFVLAIQDIPDKTVEENKTLSFTATLTDSTVSGMVFSLDKNPPVGAVIDSSSGKFTWIPTSSQAPGSYVFDIVVKKSGIEDRETVTVIVTKKAESPTPPKEEPKPKPKPSEEPEPTKVIPAPFVDPKKDPQSYVDRYNNEPTYKKWFDENYPQYSSIYEAVGLEEPRELAPFVDPEIDPQYYIDRYNNEPKYKEWFDTNFPDMTIYEAVGIDAPTVKEPEFGQCGAGTKLVDGVCEVVKEKTGGGCLIATATYGTELAPQVQMLRELRDSKVMSTDSGASFMVGFNQIYYTFSPQIADYERENPAFKEIIKMAITPMISSLSILSLADIDSEYDIIGYGIVVILLNAVMYVGAPLAIVCGFRKIRSFK